MAKITTSEIRDAFESAIGGDLSDFSFNENYTEKVSFSVREMREIMEMLGTPIKVIDPITDEELKLDRES